MNALLAWIISKRGTQMQSPEHYKSTVLMDYLISHKIGFAEGNICKYVARWDKKDGIKDLYKARDYLLALIAHEELKQLDRASTQLQYELFPKEQG